MTIVAALGCRASSPLPMPDAARASGVRLRPSTPSIVIRPSSSGRVRFEVRDDVDRPLADYPITFAIDGQEAADVAAVLSSRQSLTGENGDSVVEIIVGPLAGSDRPASFWLLANSPGAPPAQVQVLVTTNAYAIEILPLPTDDLPASAGLTATRLYFYDGGTCADLDVFDVGAKVSRARPPNTVPAGNAIVIRGVAASGQHAVLGLGLDGHDNVQVGGCVDVPGSALQRPETMRVVLLLDRLFPAVAGAYQVQSEFLLAPPPPALATLVAPWRQWARCPLDPARLWIDCTLAALEPDTAACSPIKPEPGSFADRLSSHRGTVVPALNGAAAAAGESPCRGPSDSVGNPSLEAVVDALFNGTRTTLSGYNLGGFPDELARLFDDLRLDSRLTLVPASQPNTYWAQHELLTITFPHAAESVGFAATALGLPDTKATGILALIRSGQVGVPSHGFTLRLGSTGRAAFEATSLRARGAANGAAMVERVFSLARSSDQRGALAGCAALDAAVCDVLGQSWGCLGDACWAGLSNLARSLTSTFSALDGAALDLRMYGSAPVIDVDSDGRGDALGMAAKPGLWSASLETSRGGYAAYGAWSAIRLAAPR